MIVGGNSLVNDFEVLQILGLEPRYRPEGENDFVGEVNVDGLRTLERVIDRVGQRVGSFLLHDDRQIYWKHVR